MVDPVPDPGLGWTPMTQPAPHALALDSLSPSQQQAVLATEGPVLLLAGAGSGKTRVITHRIAHLLLDRAVPPHRILAVTFTNKAAREMRERIEHFLGAAAPRSLWITTFHALGARLLRLHAEAAGLDPGFTIFDETDAERVIRRIYKETGFDTELVPVGGARASISLWKSQGLRPQDLSPEDPEVDRRKLLVYQSYQEELAKQNAVDFADLIALPVRLLAGNDEIRNHYQERFRHLMVDEYQDTDRTQYRLMKLLTGPGANLCVVGDEDQSIYGWRGADIRNILDFEADYPGARVLQLEVNYRCPTPVLEAANRMIGHNRSRRKEREVWSDKPSRHKVAYFHAQDAEEEAEFVVQAIRWMVAEEGFDRDQIAIFYRTHALARTVEQALVRHALPYRVYGGLRFFERKVVKDLLAYLRLVVNPRDRDALVRALSEPKRGIGDKAVEKLLAAADRTGEPGPHHLRDPKVMGGKAGRAGLETAALLDDLDRLAAEGPPLPVLRHLIERLSYRAHLIHQQRDDDLELVDELENAMAEYAGRVEEPTLRGFLEDASLLAGVDDLQDGRGTVSLMTLHNAKGLEFPLVFVVGLEEGILPHASSYGDPDQLEEERRLLYVGMTRAKQRLFLSASSFRFLHGTQRFGTRSRFLEEIGEEHLQVGNGWV